MEKKAEHEMKTRFGGLEFGFGCGGGGVGASYSANRKAKQPFSFSKTT